jgi:hypothetical protein
MIATARKMHLRMSILHNITQQPKFQVVSRGLLRSQQWHDHVVNVDQRRIMHTFRSRRSTTITPMVPTSYQQSSHGITSLYNRQLPFGTSFTERSAMMAHRWLSDANVDGIDGKDEEQKENGTNPTKEVPKLTAEMKRDLAILEKRFLRLELEPHGRYRGIEVALKMIREEKLEKRVTKALANLHLNNWIYRLYSLKLGYEKITDVPGDILANTLIRDGTTIRFWKYKNAKTILKEMYRYPTRPTSMQQRYVEKDYKAESLANGEGMISTSAMATPLTPEEEEREKQMWDPRLFRPKLYGYKARREAKKRKRQQAPK